MAELSNEQELLGTVKKEHRALALLRLLQREPGYRLNDQITLSWFKHLALASTDADIRQCAKTLEIKGLIQIETVDGVLVFSLTSDGEDVALGRNIIDGVLRPRPDCNY